MRQNFRVSRRLAIRVAVTFLLVLVPVATSASRQVALAAPATTVTGTVFKDYNSNGEMDTEIAMGVAVDVGVEGIRVRAFDSTGAKVGETLSGSDGTYTITIAGAATSNVRIEFEIPSSDASLTGLVPSYSPTTATSTDPRSGTSIQFVTIGAADVNFSVINPTEYCQSNPKLLTCMYPMGAATGKTAPGAVLFSSSLSSDPGIPNVGYNSTSVKQTADNLGSVFGIGIDRSGSVTAAPNAFIGTYVKRTSEYGNTGGATNTIYRLTVPSSGSGTLSTFVTLPGTLPSHTATSTTALFTGVDYAEDTDIFSEVGRIGLGDVDVTPDGSTVLAVDMNEAAPKLYFIPILGTGNSVTAGTPTSKSIAKPSTFDGVACPGNWHPMGIGVRGDRILVGGVCGAENTVTSSDPNGPDPTESTAFVLEYSGALDGSGSFTTIYAMELSYERGCALREDCTNTTSTVGSRNTADWGAWNEYPQMFSKYGKLLSSNPQAMLANIEIADNGDLILDFRDRYSDQQKTNSAAWSDAYDDSFDDPPAAYPQIAEVFSAGDILRVCNSAGTLTLESSGTCAGLAGSESTDPAGGMEFYYDPFPFYGNSGDDATVHPETALGSSATMAGYPGVWSTAYDISWVNQQGVLSFGNCDALTDPTKNCRPIGTTTGYGSRIGGVIFPFSGGGYTWATQASWEKGNGLADLEVLCNQAPVQIGNRVWIDTDKDGIQDPGETPVADVVVHLYNSSGTLVGTAITNAAGEYYFSSSGTEASDGGATPDAYGYGLTTGEEFTIRFDDPDNYAFGGPLVGYFLTSTDSTTASTFDLDNLIDNDATAVTAESEPTFGINSFPRITVSSLSPGTNDHSFDVGFYTPPTVGVGSTVWIDADRDGIQDVGEPGKAGIVVTLYLPDGVTPVTKPDGTAATATTDASGNYFIDGLLPGLYRASFAIPAGYSLTTALAGSDVTLDSNPNVTTFISATFTVAETATGTTIADTDAGTTATFVNPTIDAGLVPTVAVGNYTWIDADADGVQDVGESPLAGVTVALLDSSGNPARDADGDLVTAQVTGANGAYFFDNLLPGTYKMQFTPPTGWVTSPKDAASGTQATDSDADQTTGITDTFTIAAYATGDTVADTDAATTAVFVNPTIDAGFIPRVSVGNYVWMDTDRDGVQDRGEKGIAGVTLTITKADGSAVTDVNGNPVTTTTTNANGYYTFDNLPVGQYKVTVAPPPDVLATRSGAGSTSTDSSRGTATSISLTTNGQRDPTLDFGFYPIKVSVGDWVWRDLNGDGYQSKVDWGLAGATLRIFDAAGQPARDVNGKLVAPQVTGRDGKYLFTNLPPGKYTVKITYPIGFRATTRDRPDRARNSSTGRATSLDLQTDGASDLTLDFGVVGVYPGGILPPTR